MKKRIACGIIGLSLMSILLVATISTQLLATPQEPTFNFALSSWDYPDDYGQGIYGVIVWENSTGSWQTYDMFEYTDTPILEWNITTGIQLGIVTFLNNTLIQASDYIDGQKYQRHNVTITNLADEIVFEKNNLTFGGFSDWFDPMWGYQYDVILDFTPLAGEYYTVSITYEIWW